MSTTDIGKRAESAVAEYLRVRGFTMLDRNWRTRWCEIDIVAEKRRVIYFIEVKYRRSVGQGSGLDYVTPKKLEQMRFAAENWVSEHDWRGECQLAAAEVSGVDFQVENFVTELL